MEKAVSYSPELRQRILDAAIPLFNARGLKFTMDDLARSLSMSKKTIYAVFPDKATLLHETVDYCFDFIGRGKERIIRDEGGDLPHKLRLVLGLLTDKYESIDLSRLHVLREKYPAVYAHVAERLESGWESTVALLEQGMTSGQLRRVSIPIFKTMMEATLERFFQNDILVRSGLTYQEALDQVVDILLCGVIAGKEENNE